MSEAQLSRLGSGVLPCRVGSCDTCLLSLSNAMLPSSGFPWLLGASHTPGGAGCWVGEYVEEEEEQSRE